MSKLRYAQLIVWQMENQLLLSLWENIYKIKLKTPFKFIELIVYFHLDGKRLIRTSNLNIFETRVQSNKIVSKMEFNGLSGPFEFIGITLYFIINLSFVTHIFDTFYFVWALIGSIVDVISLNRKKTRIRFA